MGATDHRLLIADDEVSLLANLTRAAEAEGYSVDTATDGLQAWSLLSRGQYDLLVTDLRMPGLDGPELMGRIVQEGLPVQVIVITGYATLEAAVDCLRKHAVDFLVKPFAVEDLLKRIRVALDKRPAQATSGPDWEQLKTRYGLTRRQGEILRLFYAGAQTNRDLADELCLSPDTVKSHLKAAFSKVGVSTRAQLLKRVREFSES